VRIGDMKKIQKRVKMDYQLALDLYDTGIADAMYLAGLIADDARMTRKDLQKWVKGANCVWVAEYTVPWVASAGPHGREMALKWIESKDETIASAGWQTYSSMVAIKEDADLDLAEIKSLLQRVAKSIHQQPNRVKYMMNNFVIAVACFVKPLHKLAVDAAKGIGGSPSTWSGIARFRSRPIGSRNSKPAARSARNASRRSVEKARFSTANEREVALIAAKRQSGPIPAVSLTRPPANLSQPFGLKILCQSFGLRISYWRAENFYWSEWGALTRPGFRFSLVRNYLVIEGCINAQLGLRKGYGGAKYVEDPWW